MSEIIDTDVLLAILASLLDETSPSHEELLNSLIDYNGDVEAAAQSLRQRSSGSATGESGSKLSTSRRISGHINSTSKRKRGSGLDGWLAKAPGETPLTDDAGTESIMHNAKRKRASIPASAKEATAIDNLPSPSVSPKKPTVNLMDVLKDKTSLNAVGPPRMAPLTLGTPALVAQHTPCTLHYKALPSELASRLFHVMVDESQAWKRNEWWLFDRLVESPHRTAFYARKSSEIEVQEGDTWKDTASLWYNGRRTDPPLAFPPVMEEACRIIEDIVNAEMKKRPREPLEWGGSKMDGKMWRANVAGSNCYEGAQESVGSHSDSLTYLGPNPTIASLSLGTSRNFRLRDVVHASEAASTAARTFNIPLVHNSLVIMHAGCQERFKHCVPPQRALDTFTPAHPHPSAPAGSKPEPSNCRINITFRFFRPDFRPDSVPKCACGVPCVLRPDMKGRADLGEAATGAGRKTRQLKYWWTCNGAASKEGNGCGMWRIMDVKAEGRGPFVMDMKEGKPDSDRVMPV